MDPADQPCCPSQYCCHVGNVLGRASQKCSPYYVYGTRGREILLPHSSSGCAAVGHDHEHDASGADGGHGNEPSRPCGHGSGRLCLIICMLLSAL